VIKNVDGTIGEKNTSPRGHPPISSTGSSTCNGCGSSNRPAPADDRATAIEALIAAWS